MNNRYDVDFSGEWVRLTGGYESDVYRVGDVVVRISPEWRKSPDLQWVHDAVRHIHKAVWQAIAPITANDGSTFFRWEDKPISVFPYVDASRYTTYGSHERDEFAMILAQIHRAGYSLRDNPRPSGAMTQIPDDFSDPDSILDSDLDDWYENTFLAQNPTMGLVHGDYYRANILGEVGHRVEAVIDWDECEIRPIIGEVAWSTWEICKSDDGTTLNFPEAQHFIEVYRRNMNILPDHEYDGIIPLIRRHLRYEVRRALMWKSQGHDVDEDYLNAEIEAFHNLRDKSL